MRISFINKYERKNKINKQIINNKNKIVIEKRNKTNDRYK